MPGKKVVLWLLVGWLAAVVISPRDVIAMVKPKSAM